jgi:methylenetetrahydrofolate reductase (NADPH)
MSLARSLKTGRFAVALEITPPKGSLPRVLERRARLLGSAPIAINVIQRPDRQPSLEAAIELVGMGLDPVWHLVTRGKPRADLDADLARALQHGVRNILCIRGDHPASAPDELSVRDACEAARAAPGTLVGATLNQYVSDRAAVLRNLIPKLRAGASYAQTQPVFDARLLFEAADAVLQRSPSTRILAMAMPISSPAAAARIETRLGVSLPARLRGYLDAGDVASAWSWFEETLARVVESPLIAGVALMTFETDPDPSTAARILTALQRSGATPAGADPSSSGSEPASGPSATPSCNR